MVNRSSLIMALMRYWSHVEVMLQRTLTAHAHQYTQNTIHLTRRSLDAHKKNYIKNGEQRSRPYSRKGAIVRNQRRHFIGATRLRCLLVLPTYTHTHTTQLTIYKQARKSFGMLKAEPLNRNAQVASRRLSGGFLKAAAISVKKSSAQFGWSLVLMVRLLPSLDRNARGLWPNTAIAHHLINLLNCSCRLMKAECVRFDFMGLFFSCFFCCVGKSITITVFFSTDGICLIPFGLITFICLFKYHDGGFIIGYVCKR